MTNKTNKPARSADAELLDFAVKIATENAEIREISDQVVGLQRMQRAAIDRRNALLAQRDAFRESLRQKSRNLKRKAAEIDARR